MSGNSKINYHQPRTSSFLSFSASSCVTLISCSVLILYSETTGVRLFYFITIIPSKQLSLSPCDSWIYFKIVIFTRKGKWCNGLTSGIRGMGMELHCVFAEQDTRCLSTKVYKSVPTNCWGNLGGSLQFTSVPRLVP